MNVGGLLRLTVAAALVGYLLWRADPDVVWQALVRASWPPLLIAVGLVLVDRAFMAYRWFVLLRSLEVRLKDVRLKPDATGERRQRLPPFRIILRIFFVSSFIGTFLPGSVGGDAVRAYSLSTHGVPVADSMASVFVDRMLGVLSLLLMALVGIAIGRDLAADQTVVLGLAATALACIMTGILIFSSGAETGTGKLLVRLPWERVRRAPGLLFTAIRRYSSHHGALGNVLVGSLAVQVLRIVQAYFLGIAIGIQQPLIMYFAFIPLILLIMLLPITVNGLGTSQAAFIWLFGRVGTPEGEAFALSVLFVALGLVGNIPGAIFYAGRPSRDAPALGGMQ